MDGVAQGAVASSEGDRLSEAQGLPMRPRAPAPGVTPSIPALPRPASAPVQAQLQAGVATATAHTTAAKTQTA